MREDIRFVKVKSVDDVGVAQRFEEEQIIVVGPMRSGRNDGVVWRSLADCCCKLSFNAIPTKLILSLRLVEDLKEHAIRIKGRVVPRKCPPEIRKFFHKFIVREALFEFGISLYIEFDREPLIEDHLD